MAFPTEQEQPLANLINTTLKHKDAETNFIKPMSDFYAHTSNSILYRPTKKIFEKCFQLLLKTKGWGSGGVILQKTASQSYFDLIHHHFYCRRLFDTVKNRIQQNIAYETILLEEEEIVLAEKAIRLGSERAALLLFWHYSNESIARGSTSHVLDNFVSLVNSALPKVGDFFSYLGLYRYASSCGHAGRYPDAAIALAGAIMSAESLLQAPQLATARNNFFPPKGNFQIHLENIDVFDSVPDQIKVASLRRSLSDLMDLLTSEATSELNP